MRWRRWSSRAGKVFDVETATCLRPPRRAAGAERTDQVDGRMMPLTSTSSDARGREWAIQKLQYLPADELTGKQGLRGAGQRLDRRRHYGALRARLRQDARTGSPSRGVRRLPMYIAQRRNGRVDSAAVPGIVRDKGAALLIDAADGLAFAACELAIATGIERARQFGTAAASIVRNHRCWRGAYSSSDRRVENRANRLQQCACVDAGLGRQKTAIQHQTRSLRCFYHSTRRTGHSPSTCRCRKWRAARSWLRREMASRFRRGGRRLRTASRQRMRRPRSGDINLSPFRHLSDAR